MKTRRRRNRAGVARNPEPAQDNNGSEEVVDGELSDVTENGDVSLENGAESRLEEDGAAVASGNGVDSEDENVVTDGEGNAAISTTSASGGNGSGNGSSPNAARNVIPNLPRRRP